ncbi:hypothetical protein D7Y15_17890 [Corallococcus sp. AB030]|nr:hypothetical protein D7V77_12280 [Corallococcus sp. CA041A]RKI12769.1 hypothetical protein D7Y15_17890 [Corallococcus sp. AB030]RUO94271.1 hypothetical protein D7Y11_05265 [Corallococcus sp. AB018]
MGSAALWAGQGIGLSREGWALVTETEAAPSAVCGQFSKARERLEIDFTHPCRRPTSRVNRTGRSDPVSLSG